LEENAFLRRSAPQEDPTMRKRTFPKLHLSREVILNLETPALRDAAGAATQITVCATNYRTCLTCHATCTA
jgi:hypothetical protein